MPFLSTSDSDDDDDDNYAADDDDNDAADDDESDRLGHNMQTQPSSNQAKQTIYMQNF